MKRERERERERERRGGERNKVSETFPRYSSNYNMSNREINEETTILKNRRKKIDTEMHVKE